MCLTLADGKKTVLVNKQGVRTDAGNFWYNQVEFEVGGHDINAEIHRRAETRYIQLRNGAKLISGHGTLGRMHLC